MTSQKLNYFSAKPILIGAQFELDGSRYIACTGYGGEGFEIEEAYYIPAFGMKNIKVYGCKKL